MIRINSYSKSKGTGNTSSSGGGGNSYTYINAEIPNVKIWGQDHDHTKDIDGDLTSQGTVTAQNGVFNNDLTANTAQFDNVTAEDARLQHISSGDIDNTGIITTSTLDAEIVNSDEANITSLISTNIVTDYLQVLYKAHFTELEIDKVTAVGGNLLLTAANAVIDKVVTTSSYIRCYWKKKDFNNTAIDNQFVVGDQIICQSFDVVDGTTYNAENKFYWRLVTGVGQEETTIENEPMLCNFIDLSLTDMATGSDDPSEGDNIAQLGNRTDTDRQNAIILAAYNSMDANVEAPSITQYVGINSYSLDGHILNTIGAGDNTFTGTFRVVNGGTTTDIRDLIGNKIPEIKTDNEIAFYSADGNSKISTIADMQNFPQTIELYHGGTLVSMSQLILSASYIQYNGNRILLTQQIVPPQSGPYLSGYTIGNNSISLTWGFAGVTQSAVTNDIITIHLEFTDSDSVPHAVTKNVPVQVIKNGVSISGADAEFYKMQVLEYILQVNKLGDLHADFSADIKHIKGDTVTNPTSTSNMSAYLLFNTASSMAEAHYINISSSGGMVLSFNVQDYMELTDKPTSATVYLMIGNTLADTVTTQVSFEAGSVFEVTDEAVTFAVQQANEYTNTQSAQWQLTAQGISSRVTNIENDYVTSSQITQTANEIQLNVYNNLREKTGIDITNGTITLDATKTVIKGNLTLTDANDGFTILDEDGNPVIQISNNEIGTTEDYNGQSSYNISAYNTASGSGYYVGTTATRKIGYLKANSTVTLSNTDSLIYAERNNAVTYPSASTATITGVLRKQGSQTVIQQFTLTGTKQYNNYKNNGTTTITIPSDGIYNLQYTIQTSSALPTQNTYDITALVTVTITTSETRMTVIGKDGMLSNPHDNAYLASLSDCIMMRWGDNAVRVNDKGIQVLTNTSQKTWIPVNNYTPVFVVGDIGRPYAQTYINKISQTKYAYQIDPVNDCGMCLVNTAYNSLDQKQDSWILLPPTSWTDSSNVSHTLPIGYTVHIVNNSTSGDRHNVYVTSQDIVNLIDDNFNNNTYYRINNDSGETASANDEYVWTGLFWRAMRDTQ